MFFAVGLFINLPIIGQDLLPYRSYPEIHFTTNNDYCLVTAEVSDTYLQVNKVEIKTGKVLNTIKLEDENDSWNEVFGPGEFLVLRSSWDDSRRIVNTQTGAYLKLDEMRKSKVLGLTNDEKNVVFYRSWSEEIGMVNIESNDWNTLFKTNSENIKLAADGTCIYYLKGSSVYQYNLKTGQNKNTGLKSKSISYCKTDRYLLLKNKKGHYYNYDVKTKEKISVNQYCSVDRNEEYGFTYNNKELINISSDEKLILKLPEGFSNIYGEDEWVLKVNKELNVLWCRSANKDGNQYLMKFNLSTGAFIEKHILNMTKKETKAIAEKESKKAVDQIALIKANLSNDFRYFLSHFDELPNNFTMTIESLKGRDLHKTKQVNAICSPNQECIAIGKITDCGDKVSLLVMVSGSGNSGLSSYDLDMFKIITYDKATEEKHPFDLNIGQIRFDKTYKGHSQGIQFVMYRNSEEVVFNIEKFAIDPTSSNPQRLVTESRVEVNLKTCIPVQK